MFARMVKLVDTTDSKSVFLKRSPGSSPGASTNLMCLKVSVYIAFLISKINKN